MTTATGQQPRRVVRVWFGEHPIAEYQAEPGLAGRYEAAMKRRFPSLRVTNNPVGQSPGTSS